MSHPTSLKNITQPQVKANPSNELHALWQKIEKHQKRNAAYQKKILNNFQLFKEQALEHEQNQAYNIAKHVEHLSSFVTKKSLTEAERQQLVDWISEELGYLEHHPFAPDGLFNKIEAKVSAQIECLIKQSFSSLNQDELNNLRADLKAEFGDQLDLSDQELMELMLDPDRIYQHLDALSGNATDDHDDAENDNADFNDQNEENSDPFDDNFYDDFYRHFKQQQEHEAELHQTTQNQLDKLFKGSQLNKMYKRLASKLHPDKELDPQLKKEKHIQMQVLAQARQHKDGFTILQMYLQHFDDDPSFDQNTISSLLPLFEQKLRTLNSEYRDLQHSSNIETMVWKRFKAQSKKLILQNITNHILELQAECHAKETFIKQCKTVKQLKTELSLRAKQNMFNPFRKFDEDAFNALFGTPF